MRECHLPSSSVVVGIDGSRAAVRAALWAIDEAVSRDMPLRMICAINPDGTKQHDLPGQARELATAELAVRYAFMAVESTEKLVKIEVEVIQDSPIRALIEASRSAAVMCVGAIGQAHFAPDRVGSTAATLASSAHCPVAIIRGRDRPFADRGSILAYIGTARDGGGVLQAALEEAQLRGLPLQAVTAWQSRFTDVHDLRAVAEGNRGALAHLDRLIAPWARRYPDVDISSVAVHGSLLDHLAKNVTSVRLVVMGTHDCAATQIVEPAANALLHDADCSVLIVGSGHL